MITMNQIIDSNIRSSNAIARLGGDEFAVLLVETDVQEAVAFIKKVQYELLLAMESHTFPVTFSFGIATLYSFAKNIREMMNIADSCMYSKNSGKNKISLLVVR